MRIQEVINHIMKTPANTNPAVLKSMLESLNGEGGESLFYQMELDLTTFTLDISFDEINQNSIQGKVGYIFQEIQGIYTLGIVSGYDYSKIPMFVIRVVDGNIIYSESYITSGIAGGFARLDPFRNSPLKIVLEVHEIEGSDDDYSLYNDSYEENFDKTAAMINGIVRFKNLPIYLTTIGSDYNTLTFVGMSANQELVEYTYTWNGDFYTRSKE